MKTNKLLIAVLTLSLLSFYISPAVAQSAKEITPEERAQKWDVWMKKQLTLSTDQEVNVHTINLKYATLNEELKTADRSKMSKFRELKTNDKNKDGELKKVLTQEQFQIYQDKKRAYQKQMLEDFRN